MEKTKKDHLFANMVWKKRYIVFDVFRRLISYYEDEEKKIIELNRKDFPIIEEKIDIDALIKDMNSFLLSTELHIASGMLYKADEIEFFNNDETTNAPNIDTHINDTRKSFLSEATKDDPVKDISLTTSPYNDEFLPSLKNLQPHPGFVGVYHPGNDQEWDRPAK